MPLSSSCTGLLGRSNSLTSQEIIASDVMKAMVSLIGSLRHKRQLAGLRVIAGLALSSDSAARKLLSPEVLGCIQASPYLRLHSSLCIGWSSWLICGQGRACLCVRRHAARSRVSRKRAWIAGGQSQSEYARASLNCMHKELILTPGCQCIRCLPPIALQRVILSCIDHQSSLLLQPSSSLLNFGWGP